MKNLIRVLLALLLGLSVYGQIAIKVGGGYGFPTAGEAITLVKSGTTYDIKYSTYGKGIYPEVGVWYGLTDYLYVGLDINYLLGLKTKYTNTANYDSEEYSSSMLQILPGLQFRAGDGGVIPYANFQPIIGVGSKVKFTGVTSGNTATVTEEIEITGGTALGFKTGAGLLFDLGGLKLFTELGIYTISWKPKTLNSSITTEVVGGGTITKTESAIFVSKGYDPNSDTQEPAPKIPFNAAAFKVGVMIGN